MQYLSTKKTEKIMKKTLLFAGLLSGSAAVMAANVGTPSMTLSIETPSGKQEALVSTLAPSVTSNGRTISYARSCKVDGSGKPSIERATVFEGTTVTVHPKQINDGTRVIANVVAVNTRLRKMDKVEQGAATSSCRTLIAPAPRAISTWPAASRNRCRLVDRTERP